MLRGGPCCDGVGCRIDSFDISISIFSIYRCRFSRYINIESFDTSISIFSMDRHRKFRYIEVPTVTFDVSDRMRFALHTLASTYIYTAPERNVSNVGQITDHPNPNLPLRYVAQHLHSTDPTYRICVRSCRLYDPHQATRAISYRSYRSGIYLPCPAGLDYEVGVDDPFVV